MARMLSWRDVSGSWLGSVLASHGPYTQPLPSVLTLALNWYYSHRGPNDHPTATYNRLLGPLCCVHHSSSHTTYGPSHLAGFPCMALGLLCFLWMAPFLAWTPLKTMFSKISFSGNCSYHFAWVALPTVMMSAVSYPLQKANLSPALPLPSFGLTPPPDCCPPYHKATPTLCVPETLNVNMCKSNSSSSSQKWFLLLCALS